MSENEHPMKPQFGNRGVVEAARVLQDIKIRAAVQECIDAGQPHWVWPVQVRRFAEADVREALKLGGGR